MNESTDAKQKTLAPGVRTGHRARRWHLVAFGIVILVSGIAIGACGSLWLARKMVLTGRQHPERVPEWATQRLRRTLDLSDGQAEEVKAIIEKRLDALRTIRDDTRPRVTEQLDLLEEEIAAVLDGDQEQEWHRRAERLRNRLLPTPSTER